MDESKKTERIGILGGTFNPVHNGHLHLARAFRERLALTRVLLIPTHQPPHKRAPGLMPARTRLEMCALAAQEEPGVGVSDIEIRRGGTSYTVDTLRELSALYPEARLFFIMGADMFLTFEKWKDFDRIAALADLCATARTAGGTEDLTACARRYTKLYGARCHVENVPVLEISSTQIRARIASGADLRGLVPDAVANYIRRHGLYADGGRNSKTAGVTDEC